MKLKTILIALLMSTILCACAQAPENVKQQAEILDNSGQDVLSQSHSNSDSADINSNIEYVEQKERGSLADIRAQLETDIALNNSRIIVLDAYVGQGDIMPTYSTRVGSAGIENVFELIEFIYSDEYDTSNEELYHLHAGTDPIYLEYEATDYPCDYNNDGRIETPNSYIIDMYFFHPDEKNPNLCVGTHSSGLVTGYEENEYYAGGYDEVAVYNFLSRYGDIVDRYKFNVASEEWVVTECDASEISYKMADGSEWAITDAVAFAEEYYNEHLTVFEVNDVTFKVATLSVCDLENGCYGYYMTMSCFDENGNYINTESNYEYDWEKIGNNEAFYIENQSFFWTYKKDVACNFSKDFGTTERTAIDSGDDLITLSQAINTLDESLAQEISLTVPCAQLCYVVTCTGYGEIYDRWNVDRSEKYFASENYYESICFRDCDFELRPMWVFKSSNYSYIDIGSGKAFMVDAKSGEVITGRYYIDDYWYFEE